MPKKFYRRKAKKAAPITKKRILDIVHNDGMKAKVYKMARWRQLSPYLYNPGTVVDAGFSFEFRLDDVINASEFKDLYDSYCISKIDMVFIPIGCVGLTGITSDNTSTVGYVIDYDDSVVPSGMSDLVQYDNFRVVSANKQFKLSLVPRVSTEIYKTTLTTGYGIGTARTWLDCANGDIPHFGVKLIMSPPSIAGLNYYQVFVKYHFEFRNVR